jgi:hypothetical protein
MGKMYGEFFICVKIMVSEPENIFAKELRISVITVTEYCYAYFIT